MSKKKKNRRTEVNYTAKDYHHCLWQARYWKSGWAKRLREHRYCGEYIPKATLHRQIHEAISNVPVPEGKHCRQAYEAIESWLEAGYISIDDPIQKKLETLVKCFNANSPATANALRRQIEIVARFYEGRP